MALKAKLTLVVYMGVNQAAHIQASLLVHLPPRTPVALVQNASGKNEVRRTTTLSDITACLVRGQLASPLVMIIGDVALGAVQQASCVPVPTAPTAVSPLKDRYNRRLVG
jgi:uroporphyrin-III C-methyltransferase